MELQPGEGVGSSKLGMTLWDTINLLRSTSVRQMGNLTQSNISWSAEDPHSSYIVITMLFGSATAYRLIYSGIQQRLELVEVLPPAISSVITWKGQPLFPSSSSTSTSDGSAFMLNPQRALNSKFGPTYPPSIHPSFPEELVLTYPGVAFAFHKAGIVPGGASNGIPTTKKGDAGTGTTTTQKCPLTRLVVSRHDPSANHATAYPDISRLEQNTTPYAIAEGDVACVDIQLAAGNSTSTSKAVIHLISLPSGASIEPVEVILGQTTAEDITCTLGPPLRTYYKEDTRLSIHDQTTNSANGTEIPPNAYFFNYFSLGLDFLFHPESNKLIKILLHSNTPGEVLFGRYNKCRWRLKRNGQSEGVATSEDDIKKVKAFFDTARSPGAATPERSALRTEKTMLLDRLADSTDGVKLDRTTDLMAYPGCILEVTQNGCIETLWIV